MIVRLLVAWAYFVQDFVAYKNTKQFFNNLFYNPTFKYKRFFDFAMIFFVISSVVLLIQEVKHTVDDWLMFYNYTVITIIFIVEYLIRFWLHGDMHSIIIKEHKKSLYVRHKLSLFKLLKKMVAKKIEYLISLAAIIDLLAIFPSYRPLRVLRVFLLFRAFKLLRYTKSIQNFFGVIAYKKFELFTLLGLVSFIVFVAAVLMYVFEANDPRSALNTFLDAIYWALVTISTVGYGDISPVTVEGKIVSMIVIISGIGVLAFTTSIIVSAFTEKLDEMKILQSQQKTQRLHELYLVLGYSTMAQLVCARLARHSTPIVVIDKDPLKVEQAEHDGFIAIKADASTLQTYKDINLRHIDDIKAALCLVDDEVQSTYITLTLKAINPKMTVYSRANSRSLVEKLKRAGASYVIYAYESIGQMAQEYVGHTVVFDAINELITGHGKNQAHEIALYANDKIVGTHVNSVDFRKMRMILLGIQRESGFVFNPKAHVTFQADDVLIVICTLESLEHFYEVVLKAKRSKRDA